MYMLSRIIIFLFIICFTHAEVTIKDDGKHLDVTSHFTAKGKKFTMRNTRPGDEEYFQKALTDAKLNSTYFESPQDGEIIAASPEARKQFYQRHKNKWEQRNLWTNYLIFNDQDQFVGWVSLQSRVSYDPDEGGIAYLILPEFQGNGIASAAVKEAVEEIAVKHLTNNYQLPGGSPKTLVTMVLVNNTPSVKILEKNGFTPSQDFEVYGTKRRWYLRSLKY